MARLSEGDIAQSRAPARDVEAALEPLRAIGASQYYYAVPPLLTSAPLSVSNYPRPVSIQVFRDSGSYFMSFATARVNTQQGIFLAESLPYEFLLHPAVQTVGVTAVTGTGQARISWIFIDPLP